MKNVIAIGHRLAVLTALGLSLLSLWVALSGYHSEPTVNTIEHLSLALVCGVVVAMQIHIILSKRLTLPAALLFYPIFGALALFAPAVARGSFKRWAPATGSEAIVSDVLWCGAVVALLILSVWSSYRPRNRVVPHAATELDS
jgi:hypothetical protein